METRSLISFFGRATAISFRRSYGYFCFAIALCVASVASASTAKSSFEQGVKYYKNYQFKEAAAALEAALKQTKEKLQRNQKQEAYLLLSVCYYNLAQPSVAKTWFHHALQLNSDAKIPGPQAPDVFQHFEQIRKQWLAQKLSARLPTQRTPEPRRTTPPPVQPAPKGFAQRHIASLVIFGVGALVGGGALAFGIVFQNQKGALQQSLQTPNTSTGTSLQEAHDNAANTGLIATVLLISSGGLVAVALGTFIAESFVKPRITPLPPPTAPAKSETMLRLQ